MDTTDTSFKQIDLPIGDCLRRGWDLAIANFGPLLGYTCIVMAIHISLGLIPLAGTLVGWVIQPSLSAGFFVYIRKKHRGEQAQFGNFFDGFQFFGQLFVLGLVSGALIGVGTLLCILPGLYLFIGYMFSPFLVVARGLDFWPAMETSRRGVTANLGSVVVLFLVTLGLNLGGALLCGVGLFLTIPWTFCAGVVAFHFFFDDDAQDRPSADAREIPPPLPPPSGPVKI